MSAREASVEHVDRSEHLERSGTSLLRADGLVAGYLPGVNILNNCDLYADDGELVGIATWMRAAYPDRPAEVAFQLRGMATDPAMQGTGVGEALLALDRKAPRRTGRRVARPGARRRA